MALIPEEPIPPVKPRKSAYLKFQHLEISNLRKLRGEVSLVEISKHVSGKWKKMAKSERDALIAEWEAELDAYDNSPEYLDYLKKHAKWTQEVNEIEGIEREKAGKRQRRTEKPLQPQRPTPPFVKFQCDLIMEIKKTCPDVNQAQLRALVSHKWAKIPKSKKAALSTSFKAEIAAYKQSPEYIEYMKELKEWQEEVDKIERIEEEKVERKQQAYEKTAENKILTRNKRRKINGEDVKGRGARSRPKRNAK